MLCVSKLWHQVVKLLFGFLVVTRGWPSNTADLVIRALLLIFDPVATWDRIVQARHGIAFIVAAYLVPCLLLAEVASGFGLVHWGKTDPYGIKQQMTFRQAIVFEVARFLLDLAVVFGSAKTVKALGETFHSRHTFTQAFTTVAYGLAPVFLLRLLEALPIHPAVPWAIGIVLAFAVLYHGVPKVMEPDPSHAFGLYLTTVILLTLTTGAALMAVCYGSDWIFRQSFF